MGEIIYKCTPKGWDEKRSYLLCEKVISKTSYGLVVIVYEVVKRWSASGYGEKGIFTDSLKGSQYTINELNLIEKNGR